jgi:hypothetical protein
MATNKPGKHFKIDKSTKRLMALSTFPHKPRLNEFEQKEAEIKLEPLSRNDFKTLMIHSQLSRQETASSDLRDPLWKPKKKAPTVEGGASAEGAAATPGTAKDTPSVQDNKRKGKVSLRKMKTSEDGPKEKYE